jgi:hypothetical protein
MSEIGRLSPSQLIRFEPSRRATEAVKRPAEVIMAVCAADEFAGFDARRKRCAASSSKRSTAREAFLPSSNRRSD